MKKILTVLIICFTTTLFSQNECSRFYPLKKGSNFEYTMYDHKGKAEGSTQYSIKEVSNSNGTTSATMNMEFTDHKGKNVFSSNYNISCANNMVKIDYNSLLPSEMKKQYDDMGVDMEVTGNDIEIPNDLTVGQSLTDSNIDISMNMSGIKMKVNILNYDRKVQSQETISTQAGTFNCFLLTEKTKSKIMMGNTETTRKYWLAEGVGMVKQETFNKRGKLITSTELTNYSK